MERRTFVTSTAKAAVAAAFSPLTVAGAALEKSGTSIQTAQSGSSILSITKKIGIGGTAAGNGFQENTHEQIQEAYEAAWQTGVRFFDTDPFYGIGLGERRLGQFLYGKPRHQYLLSTKVGRVLYPGQQLATKSDNIWKGPMPFSFRYDYTAAGVRRSIEDSLQRLGVSHIDIVNIHDLSSDILGNDWSHYFNIAAKGAMPALSRMREEGIIKGWGLCVNMPEAIECALAVADPDFMLIARKYTLVDHAEILNKAFPALEKAHVRAIIGAPLNNGFLAGKQQFNYGMNIPPAMAIRLQKIEAVANRYGVDVRTAALQFAAAHPATAMVLTGTSDAQHAIENVFSMYTRIPAEFWQELKTKGLIEPNAPVPPIV